jgi:hypothetical protein
LLKVTATAACVHKSHKTIAFGALQTNVFGYFCIPKGCRTATVALRLIKNGEKEPHTHIV